MDVDKLKAKMFEFLLDDDNRDFYVGDRTEEYMAQAALNVLIAIREAQLHAIEQGNLENV